VKDKVIKFLSKTRKEFKACMQKIILNESTKSPCLPQHVEIHGITMEKGIDSYLIPVQINDDLWAILDKKSKKRDESNSNLLQDSPELFISQP
jgi:hypothetical protein